MKRLHIHTNVTPAAMPASLAFYETLFGTPPTKQRIGYARWRLDDPSVNFVIEETQTGADTGIHHVGLDVDTPEEMDSLRAVLKSANVPLLDIGETECCFAKSDKVWTQDPSGVRWEAFRSHGDLPDYGAKTEEEARRYNG